METNNSTAIEPVTPKSEPEVVVLERNKSKDEASVNAGPGGVAVKTGDVSIGVGDIDNNKSVGKDMQVSGGTVNMTVNNDNSKTVNKGLASRFAKLPDAPVVKESNDMSMEM